MLSAVASGAQRSHAGVLARKPVSRLLSHGGPNLAVTSVGGWHAVATSERLYSHHYDKCQV